MSGPTENQPAANHEPAAHRDERYAEIAASVEFEELRNAHRRFVFPVLAAALVVYFTYVVLAAYAPDFMAGTVSGNVNVGLVFGLLQFVMVFAITTAYVRYARNHLDPAADQLRERFHVGDEDGAR